MDCSKLSRRNRLLGFAAGGVACAMVGAAFAAVPLYRIFCEVTGYNGTVQQGGAAPGATDRVLTIRFNATTNPGLPWRFGPDQPSVRLRIGEQGIAFYHAENLSGATVTGTATYNVTPEVVGRYFHKTQCFCFTEQTLVAGQKAEMPVAFWVDPEIAADPETRDIRTITLNYSFFRAMDDAERSGRLASAGAR
ncbi:MAG TPA: cytochrome c oxidase assembly protein [Crenalkalicoccus sp.]|jgi:cytochrome c oxidase assembly protein subunit 11|nr:cytochrome c oxidase assembly protein [Crenalkalicoccus sp.]